MTAGKIDVCGAALADSTRVSGCGPDCASMGVFVGSCCEEGEGRFDSDIPEEGAGAVDVLGADVPETVADGAFDADVLGAGAGLAASSAWSAWRCFSTTAMASVNSSRSSRSCLELVPAALKPDARRAPPAGTMETRASWISSS